MKCNHQCAPKFGIGFLMGASIGVIAGLLLAPRSGKETIEEIRKKMEEWQKKIGSGQLRDKAMQIFGDVKESSIMLYQQAKDNLRQKLSQIKENIDRQRYEAMVDDVIDELRDKTRESSYRLRRLRDALINEWEERV